MTRPILLSVFALLSLGTPLLGTSVLGKAAMAQESGGVALAPGLNGGPRGLARPLPFQPMPLVTARDLQGGPTPADRKAQSQASIAKLRGDAGFLAGFSFGTPLAASRQPQVGSDDGGGFDLAGLAAGRGRGGRPIIINNEGPLALTYGNGNLVQQQSANGPGPIAQQQLSTTGGTGTGVGVGGAVNLVTGGGNIVQRAPSGR